MDPVSIIVAALAAGAGALGAGAAEGLSSVASDAVTGAYQRLKKLVTDRGADAEALERRPGSEAKRQSLAEDLTEVDAGGDEEVLAAARELVEQLKAHRPDAGDSIGVDLTRIDVGSLTIERIHGDRVGVRVTDGRVDGHLQISDVRAGNGGQPEGGERDPHAR